MWKGIFGSKSKKEEEKNYNYEDYVGAICQVMSDENKIYFVGQIQNYSDERNEMRIGLHKGEQTPSVMHNTHIKINIQNREDVIVLYGVVTGQAASFWRVELESMMQREEQRDGFRQVLKCKATIIKHDAEKDDEIPFVCDLINISLTGIAFRSEQVFEIGEEIWVDEAVLHKNCPTKYSFKCTVRRTFKDENDKVCYGCEFERIPSSVENSLCKDLFYLQAQSINNN